VNKFAHFETKVTKISFWDKLRAARILKLPSNFQLTTTLDINRLTPNDSYRGRTAPLTSKVAFCIFIQQISVLNILNMVYTLRFFPLQNAVCFIILTYLVLVLFTFYIQGVLKLKK